MENKNNQKFAPQGKASVAHKLPYAPPRAAFVPLKMDERLTMCGKSYKGCAIKGVS